MGSLNYLRVVRKSGQKIKREQAHRASHWSKEILLILCKRKEDILVIHQDYLSYNLNLASRVDNPILLLSSALWTAYGFSFSLLKTTTFARRDLISYKAVLFSSSCCWIWILLAAISSNRAVLIWRTSSALDKRVFAFAIISFALWIWSLAAVNAWVKISIASATTVSLVSRDINSWDTAYASRGISK